MKKAGIKRGDTVIIGGVLLLALAIFCLSLFNAFSKDAAAVIIKTEKGEKTLSLFENKETTLNCGAYTLTLAIEDGKAYVKSSNCPDKTCVHTGKIEKTGEVIACVPAGVTIRVIAEEADYDFIAG